MASQQCNKPAEHGKQKHDHEHHHSFGSHVSDKIKGIFKGHGHHGQAQLVHHSANDSHCKPASSKKKKNEHHKNKGGFLHKVKDAFSDDSSDSSSDSENESHKTHHHNKN